MVSLRRKVLLLVAASLAALMLAVPPAWAQDKDGGGDGGRDGGGGGGRDGGGGAGSFFVGNPNLFVGIGNLDI